jgi:hypothetical protein
MTQDHKHPDNALITNSGYYKLLALSLGWPEGLVILLESPLRHLYSPSSTDFFASGDPIGDCFVRACNEGEIECALILLKYNGSVEFEHLSAAAQMMDSSVLTELIPALVKSRNEIQQLALQHLPYKELCSLSLPTDALLDTKSFEVYEKLESYKIEVRSCFYEESSVYKYVGYDIAIFERLYAAGFTDFNQCDGDSILRFMELQWNNYDDPPDPFTFLKYADWFICRGASLYQLSHEGYPPVYYLADCFGDNLRMCSRWYENRGQTLTSLMEKHSYCRELLCLLMTDDTQDDCQCACTNHGCCSLQQILRAFNRFEDDEDDDKTFIDAFAAMIDGLQAFAPGLLSRDQILGICQQTIRYITFEGLKLTHTCHKCKNHGSFSYGEVVFERMDAEEMHELRDEEAPLIGHLDELTTDFNRQYTSLGLGLHEFIRDYWKPRMKEVLSETEDDYDDDYDDDDEEEEVEEEGKKVDMEYKQRIREIGVILT